MKVLLITIIFLIFLIFSHAISLKSRLTQANLGEFKESGLCNEYACHDSEKGGLIPSYSKEYITTTNRTLVFRLFTQPPTKGKAGKYGSWWSLTPPSGSKYTYMTNNAICPEFNDMTDLVVCLLKKNVKVSIGPTQSIKCQDGTLISENLSTYQIFIGDAYGKNDETAVDESGPFDLCMPFGRSPLY